MVRAGVEIAILRHGLPEATPTKPITASHFMHWVRQYNTAGLAATALPPQSALAYANICGAIVSSSLQRSIDSANALNAEKLVLSDALFVEAGMPAANWPFLKLTPNTWTVIFRMLWFLGYANHCESYKQAKQRAALVADNLITLAVEHEKVLFVGHGIFNRLLVKALKQHGWSGPKSAGTNHWDFAVYAQKIITKGIRGK
jgi:hypothetical protein